MLPPLEPELEDPELFGAELEAAAELGAWELDDAGGATYTDDVVAGGGAADEVDGGAGAGEVNGQKTT